MMVTLLIILLKDLIKLLSNFTIRINLNRIRNSILEINLIYFVYQHSIIFTNTLTSKLKLETSSNKPFYVQITEFVILITNLNTIYLNLTTKLRSI